MSGATAEPRELPVVRASELARTVETQPWLIEGLWAASGVGVIGGSPKSCKSWLGLEMAVSVSTGTPCLGRFDVRRPGTALVYLAEDAPHVVRDRLLALCTHRQMSIDRLDVRVITSPVLRLDIESHFQLLAATVTRHRPRMLLLDPFVRLQRINENDAQEVATILDRLRALQRAHDMAIMVVHHTRKNGSRSQQGQALRGSGDFWAWGDSNLYLTHERKQLRLTMEHRAAAPPDPLSLQLVLDPPHLEIVAASDTAPATLEQRIIDELSCSEAPTTRTDLRRRLAVNNKRLGETLQRLEHDGQVHRSAQGWLL